MCIACKESGSPREQSVKRREKTLGSLAQGLPIPMNHKKAQPLIRCRTLCRRSRVTAPWLGLQQLSQRPSSDCVGELARPGGTPSSHLPSIPTLHIHYTTPRQIPHGSCCHPARISLPPTEALT